MMRRLEAGEEACDRPPMPTDEEIDAALEKGSGAELALWDAWEAQADAMWEVAEPLLPRAHEIVRERNLARQPWAA
eukprot:7378672-Prymnesium_polylepis.1